MSESERVFRRGSLATLILAAGLVVLLAFAARAQPTDTFSQKAWHAEDRDQAQLSDPSSRSNLLTIDNLHFCVVGMPCGEKTDKQTLRAAARYCEEVLTQQFCDTTCVSMPGYYTDPACEDIIKRWDESAWKKEADAAAKAVREEEIAHAKAFVEAVARQK